MRSATLMVLWLASTAGVAMPSVAFAQPACSGNACGQVRLSVSESCVWVTNRGDRPAIARLRVRDDLIPVALEAPDANKAPRTAAQLSPAEQRRAADCASAERSKRLLDEQRAAGVTLPQTAIDRTVAACRANPPAGAAAAPVPTTPEQGQHDKAYDAVMGRDYFLYRIRPQGPGGACIPSLAAVTSYAANDSAAADLPAARQEAAAIAARPAPAVVAAPVCSGSRSTLAAPAAYNGPHGEVGVVRRILGIPVNLDYDAVRAELQKLGRPIAESSGIGSLSLESKCGNETASFNFTADKKQLYSAGYLREAIPTAGPQALLDAIDGEFGRHWYEKTVNTASGSVVTRYWLCADPPPAYADGAESFLSSKCHYTARFDAPDRLRISYINEPVKRAHDAAAGRR